MVPKYGIQKQNILANWVCKREWPSQETRLDASGEGKGDTMIDLTTVRTLIESALQFGGLAIVLVLSLKVVSTLWRAKTDDGGAW